ncbi:MAG: hypothetical protein IIA45_00985 [Bacteroidetes bacterium]|nr:hypothetical protein [Bacteroidota bacterium]
MFKLKSREHLIKKAYKNLTDAEARKLLELLEEFAELHFTNYQQIRNERENRDNLHQSFNR